MEKFLFNATLFASALLLMVGYLKALFQLPPFLSC